MLNEVGVDSRGRDVPQRKALPPQPIEEQVQCCFASRECLVGIPSFVPEFSKETVEFRLELGITDRITPLAQESKPMLRDEDEPARLNGPRFGRRTWHTRRLDPAVGCPDDLPFRDRRSSPYVHALRNREQEPVDVSEREQTTAAFAQVT